MQAAMGTVLLWSFDEKPLLAKWMEQLRVYVGAIAVPGEE